MARLSQILTVDQRSDSIVMSNFKFDFDLDDAEEQDNVLQNFTSTMEDAENIRSSGLAYPVGVEMKVHTLDDLAS